MKKLMFVLCVGALIGVLGVGCEEPKTKEQKNEEKLIDFEVVRAREYTGKSELSEDLSSPQVYVVRSIEQLPDFIELEENDPILSIDFTKYSLLCMLTHSAGEPVNNIQVGIFSNDADKYILDVFFEYPAFLYAVMNPYEFVAKVSTFADEAEVVSRVHSKRDKSI